MQVFASPAKMEEIYQCSQNGAICQVLQLLSCTIPDIIIILFEDTEHLAKLELQLCTDDGARHNAIKCSDDESLQ